jgi:uncharacterized damage-inducible protein DinB
MVVDALVELFERDLKRLKQEVELYSSESKLWSTPEKVTNSAGNLCLHLVGNLNHFIGATLGNSGYVRDREAEFADKNVPRFEILTQIDTTIKTVTATLNSLDEQDLQNKYPLEVLGKKEMSTAFFLIHLAMHLDYHLGQINYHRRLLDNS